MDADFSHDPNDLPRLYAATHDEGYDVAVGSRYISGVNVVNWPIGRVLMSYFASKYVRIVTGFKVNDTTAGFVCYRRKVLETMVVPEPPWLVSEPPPCSVPPPVVPPPVVPSSSVPI